MKLREIIIAFVFVALSTVGYAAVELRDEGVRVGVVEEVNFVGANVTVTRSGGIGIVTVSNSGTFVDVAATGDATVGGTLGVTGLSTLASAEVTADATVGGRLTVTGTTSLGVLGTYRASVVADQTTYTLQATDSGKVYAAEAAMVLTLPTAASGLKYHVIAGGAHSINIVPGVTTDSIAYLTLDAGDKITSPGATADSVMLIGATGKWYIGSMKGTWTDGGA